MKVRVITMIITPALENYLKIILELNENGGEARVDKISDEEKKSLISSLIKEIEIFPCDEAELPLKSILFNFPVYKDGGDVCGFLWDKSTHVSTCLEVTKMMA